MNMLILLLLAVAAILVALVTIYAFRRAEPGYEDEDGFHSGLPPGPRKSPWSVRTSHSTGTGCPCVSDSERKRRRGGTVTTTGPGA